MANQGRVIDFSALSLASVGEDEDTHGPPAYPGQSAYPSIPAPTYHSADPPPPAAPPVYNAPPGGLPPPPAYAVPPVTAAPPAYAAPPNPHRDRLIAFYREKNPAKLGSVDSTLESYRGQEETLFAMLEEKYGHLGQPIPEHTRISMELGVSEAEARQIIMENVQATRAISSIPPLAPNQARVTIPIDNAGSLVPVIMSDGNHVKCTIPPGAQPGQQVVVTLPPGLPPGIHAISEDPHPHADGQHMFRAPRAAPVAPPLGPNEARVTVPPGHTGKFIPVRMSDGNQIKATLPPGARPGQQVVVTLPPGLPPGVHAVSETSVGAAAPRPAARPAGPARTESMQLASELGVSQAEARLIIDENNQAEQAFHHQPPPADPVMRLAQEMGVSREEAQRMMAENSQAASQLHSAPALAPGEALIAVPMGHTGDRLPVKMSDGNTIAIRLPAGARPGQTVKVRAPPGLPPGVHIVSTAAASPPPGPPMRAVPPPLNPGEVDVVVPPNARPGTMLALTLPDGRKVQVQVPLGATPGKKLRIHVPHR